MILLDTPCAVGEVVEIRLELYTIKIAAPPLVFALYGAFELRRGGAVWAIDPVDHSGRVEQLWKLVQRTPTVADDDGSRFMLKLDDGSEIVLPYTSGLEHAAIFGPDDNMWTPLPSTLPPETAKVR
jgi:hypothetical protein